jgi:hypothetical protein
VITTPAHLRRLGIGFSLIVQRRFEDACVEIRQVLARAAEVGCRTVTVGVNCELGRHRSVAFVEELGHMKWDGWEIVVEHRDLNVNASRSRKEKRKGDTDRGNRAEDLSSAVCVRIFFRFGRLCLTNIFLDNKVTIGSQCVRHYHYGVKLLSPPAIPCLISHCMY